MKKIWFVILLILLWPPPVYSATIVDGQTAGTGGLPACTNADYTTGTSTSCAGTPANAKVELDKKLPIASAVEVTDPTTTGPRYYIDGSPDTWANGSYAMTPVIGDADVFDDNFTGANLFGGTFIVSAAGSILLANPAAGNNFTIVLEDAVATIIEPLATGTDDTIVLNGTALTQGASIQSSTKGAICVFQYRAADSWMATCNGFVVTP